MKENPMHASQSAYLMVVDDDRVTRMTLSRVLSKAGYEVVEAANGEEALACFHERRPDLVLMDVMMPLVDGFEACGEIRKSAGHQQVPLIMLTGLNDVDSIDRAFDAGATDFITKPINWTLLLQRVRYGLHSRAMAIDLQRNQERLSQAQQIAKLGYWELELESGAFRCSAELQRVLCLESGQTCRTLNDLLARVSVEERGVVQQSIAAACSEGRSFNIEHSIQRGDGREISVQHQGALELDEIGKPAMLMGTVQDISERKRAEALIEYQAFYDGLTDLPNRRLFSDHIQHALDVARAHDHLTGVLFLGLDRFKMINDSLGHAAGDELLREVARRLKQWNQDGVGVARFGADVFAVLVEGGDQVSELDRISRELLKLIAEPIALHGQEYFSSASIGVAVAPHDCTDLECLLKAADSAMYRAKENGGGTYQYFTPDMNSRAQQRLSLEGELRKAIELEQFEIFYQPQVQAESRKIISMEALLRWRHPERGLVSPAEFIPVAEDSGLIVPIGEWVMHKACEQVAHWNRRFGRCLQIGVNLSARQFAHTELIQTVESALQLSGLKPELLDLELTESIAMQDIDACIQTLQAFHAMGVMSSMDDFGTGYSSLSYLQQLPLHTLKIDRAFVKDINDKGENGDIAKAVIAMAHSLGMAVVAEGVETEEQFDFLLEQGCDVIQGYLFSPPVDAETIGRMLRESAA
jgi:diguanylate cyclase (GGDEF)-like protein